MQGALTSPEASLPFTGTIGMIYIGTYIGGKIQDNKGPRPVALTGGFTCAFGCVPASFALLHKAASSSKNVRWQETCSEVDA